MKMKMKRIIAILMLITITLGLTSCIDDAQVASSNLVRSADNFEIDRRVVFFNGITDNYLLEINGKCSINTPSGLNALEVICKTGDNSFKKHFLGLSDNVAYFVEHLEPTTASAYNYRVTFKPQLIIPDIDLRIEDK